MTKVHLIHALQQLGALSGETISNVNHMRYFKTLGQFALGALLPPEVQCTIAAPIRSFFRP